MTIKELKVTKDEKDRPVVVDQDGNLIYGPFNKGTRIGLTLNAELSEWPYTEWRVDAVPGITYILRQAKEVKINDD